MVAMQLVGLVTRNTVEHKYTKGDKTVTIKQDACHAETNTKNRTVKLSNDKTAVSAELPKEERDVKTLPNTAIVTTGDGKVVCFRSAKTHKTDLQEQRSKADIAARVKVGKLPVNPGESVNGLTKNGDGSLSYQPVIFTMMDSNPVKAMGTSAQGLINRAKLAATMQGEKAIQTPIENEQKFLEKMVKANQDRFDLKKNNDLQIDTNGQYYIEHKVDDGKGGTVTVKEYSAIIQNHVFSGQSKKAENREHARQENIGGQIQMLKKMVEKEEDSKLFEDISVGGKSVREYVNGLGSKPTKSQLNNISECLKQAASKMKDSDTKKMVLEAFHANLFGNSIDGKCSYDKEDSGADLAMFTGIQADYLGLSFSPQCKSGNDRTIAATAHKVAQEAYFTEQGNYFDPSNHSEDEENAYKEMYTQAIITFGFSNVEASRGPVEGPKSGLKIKNSLAAYKYMNDEEVKKYGAIIE